MWKWMIGLSVIPVLTTVKAEDCSKGFYGPECWRQCKEHSHCLENDCVLLPSGRALNCSQGCKPGWRGLSCNTNCKHPCIKCDRDTGECVGACRDGYYGDRCHQYCPQHCLSCEKVSGSCLNCTHGFYGEDCSLNCSTECEECDIRSGNCLNRMNDDASGSAKFPHGKTTESSEAELDGHLFSNSTAPGSESSHSESVSHTVSSSELDSTTDFVVSSSRPNRGSSSISSSKDAEPFVIYVIIAVLVVICVVVVTFTFTLLFSRRRGRNDGKREDISPVGQSPAPGREHTYQDSQHTYPAEERMYQQTDYMCRGEEQIYSSLEHVYHEVGNPEDLINASTYITPVHRPGPTTV